MIPKRSFAAAALLLLVLGGCAKKPAETASIPLVPAAERSRYFEAVNSHLELGGTLYGYADVDGDSLKVADSLHKLFLQIAAANPMLRPYAQADYRALFVALGFDDFKAVGFSSVLGTDGDFRNREFFYTPNGRHGLLAVVGGPPAAFTRTRLAPADSDFYCETEIDLPALYATVKDVSAKLGPPGAADKLDAQIKDAGVKMGLSLLDFIGALRGRITVVARVDPDQTYTFAGPVSVVLPKYSVLICVDGVGSVVGGDLAKSTAFTETTEGQRHFFTPKAPISLRGLQPVLAVEGTTFYAATSPEFLRESLDRQSGLDQNPDFQRLLALLGPTGNGLGYVTPRFFSRFRDLGDLNAQAPLPVRNMFNAASQVPVPNRPLMAVRENLADGILVRSSFNRSLKREIALVAIYNPVTIGLAAAIIVPAIQRAHAPALPPPRITPQMANRLIQNNLRLLWMLSARHYRESGATTATFDDLVGPGKQVPAIRSWAGENYRSINFEKGKPISVRTSDGLLFTYPPSRPAPPPTIPSP
jgi:hypothetical protein